MNKQHTPPQHSSSTIRVVHVSSNTLKAPLVYSLDSGELGYRAGEREGGKSDQSISPPLQKETRERVITSRQKNSTPTVKKGATSPGRKSVNAFGKLKRK
jgi:hypothetical protein